MAAVAAVIHVIQQREQCELERGQSADEGHDSNLMKQARAALTIKKFILRRSCALAVGLSYRFEVVDRLWASTCPRFVLRIDHLSEATSTRYRLADLVASVLHLGISPDLHKILKAFADNDINLSRIESRPSKNLLGSYLFCVDCNAHREDQNFIKAMRELSLFFNYYKWLGSYHISRSAK